MRRRLLPLFLLAATAVAVSAQNAPPKTATPQATPVQGAAPAGQAVASVNGEAISSGEYFRRLEWYRPNPNSALAAYPVGFQVLRQLISERMIQQLAKTRGVAPTAPEVDARLAQMYRDNPTLKTELTESGSSDAELRAQVVAEESQFKLMTSGVTITDLEVEKHYQENPEEFRQPAKYKLRIVAVGDDATQAKVDEALRANRPFADVAKDFSLDPATKSKGGDYGEVPESALADAARRAVEVTPVGSTSVWIQGSNSVARIKFLVEGVTPAKTVPLDAALKNRIRRRMMVDKGTVKNGQTLTKELDAATRAAKITIAQPQFQRYYDELLDRLKRSQS